MTQVDPFSVVRESLKDLSYVGKFAGFVSAMDVIPFLDPSIGVIVFAAASLLKDTANRIGNLSTMAGRTRALMAERQSAFARVCTGGRRKKLLGWSEWP